MIGAMQLHRHGDQGPVHDIRASYSRIFTCNASVVAINGNMVEVGAPLLLKCPMRATGFGAQAFELVSERVNLRVSVLGSKLVI